ncbi:tetratricopeptide repeat protein [Roseospira navarrensis]|uniref:tetratricopeptide repeat protein n=1 Tax=Roseospira navarrensis TaxID=140058 RepID=UPI001478388F
MAKTPRRPEKETRKGGTAPDAGQGGDDRGTVDPAEEALFREVDEDLRAEQMQKLWKQYGGYIVGAAVMVVAIVAGFQGWTAWQASVRADEAERYFNAVSGPGVGGPALEALAENGETGYAPLARLQRANQLADEGDTAGAIAAYDALASDGGEPTPLRHLASLLAALHAMEVEDPTSVRGRLSPLTADDSPWRFLARELMATLDMKEGRTAEARETFAALVDERDAPPGVRSRATEFLAMLGGDEG